MYVHKETSLFAVLKIQINVDNTLHIQILVCYIELLNESVDVFLKNYIIV